MSKIIENKIVFVPYYAHQINLFLLKSQLKYTFIITNDCMNDLNEIINFIIRYYSKKIKTNNKKNKIIKNLDLFIKTITNLNIITEDSDIKNNRFDDIEHIVDNYNLLKQDLNIN